MSAHALSRTAGSTATAAEAATVLAKAALRAAEQLGLKQAQLARILGLSAATASRLAGGQWQLPADSKQWELATAFVRVYRSLAALTGGELPAMQAWLHSHNRALNGEPVQRLQSAEGLFQVLHYLDAARGRN